jgi:hypothetical protein
MIKHLTNYILLLIMLAITLVVPAVAKAEGERSKQMVVRNYLREEVKKTLSQFVAQGTFSVQLGITMQDEGKDAKKAKDKSDKAYLLPLGLSQLDINSFQGEQPSMFDLVEQVKNIQIKVGLSGKVKPEIKTLIRQALTNNLLLNTTSGDSVSFINLPAAAKESVKLDPITLDKVTLDPVKLDEITIAPLQHENITIDDLSFAPSRLIGALSSIEFAGALLAIAILIGLAILMSAVQAFGNKLASSLGSMGKIIGESGENKGMGMGGAMMPMGMGGNAAAATEGTGSEHSSNAGGAGTTSANQEYWESIDLDIIRTFVMDSYESAEYGISTMTLLNQSLSNEKGQKLQENLPDGLFQYVSGQDNRTSLSSEEVTTYFQQNYLAYFTATNSNLAKQLADLPRPQLVQFISTLEAEEKLVLLKNLTPIKRNIIMEQFSSEDKINIAQNFDKERSVEKIKQLERTLGEKVEKLTPDPIKDEAGEQLVRLVDQISTPRSYAEDENFFEQGLVAGSYTSLLRTLEELNPADWEQLTLQELAIAFAGYSEAITEELLDKFQDKKRVWLEQLLQQTRNENLAYSSAQVSATRSKLVNILLKNADSEDIMGADEDYTEETAQAA